MHRGGLAVVPGVVGNEGQLSFGGLAGWCGSREIQLPAYFRRFDSSAFVTEDDHAIEKIFFVGFGETGFQGVELIVVTIYPLGQLVR